MMRGRAKVRRVWRYSTKYRVLPLDPEWLGGAEYIIVERLADGAISLKPALGVRDDGEAVRLESELNREVQDYDG